MIEKFRWLRWMDVVAARRNYSGITSLFAVALVLLNAPPTRAQTPGAPLPSFEVVSIKPNRSGVISTTYLPNRFLATTKTAKFFINMAYGSSASRFTYPLRDDQVEGGPGWINSKYYDVDAKIEDAMAEQFRQHPEQLWGPLRLMLRSMLADRFKLQVSHTTRELPVYALAAAKGGPKFLDQKMMPGDSYPSLLTPNQPSRGKPCVPKLGWACMANYMSMADLAVLLSGLPEDEPPGDKPNRDSRHLLPKPRLRAHASDVFNVRREGWRRRRYCQPPSPTHVNRAVAL